MVQGPVLLVKVNEQLQHLPGQTQEYNRQSPVRIGLMFEHAAFRMEHIIASNMTSFYFLQFYTLLSA